MRALIAGGQSMLMVPATLVRRGMMRLDNIGEKDGLRKRVGIGCLLVTTVLIVVLLLMECSYDTKRVEVADLPGSGLTVDVNSKKIGSEPGDVIGNESPMFTATGYMDREVSGNEVYALVNDVDNADTGIYVMYIVSVGDEEIFRSGLVEPGMQVNWVPGEALSIGDYEVKIREVPYIYDEDSGDWVEKYAAEQVVRICVR